ncbi:unnamed protein product [Nezara viridula]|uniref:Uncharacterized protein n=1 Tax=Nezara viridula TaxID=85310 RepID=A0A9P0H9R1_NEZVI|nr:unnamed protein product [Nezara viridula]
MTKEQLTNVIKELKDMQQVFNQVKQYPKMKADVMLKQIDGDLKLAEENLKKK